MQKYNIGDDVVVDIKDRNRFAHGCTEALDGKTGRVILVGEHSINSIKGDSPAYLVKFDHPAAAWWGNQLGPVEDFWFDPTDLAY